MNLEEKMPGSIEKLQTDLNELRSREDKREFKSVVIRRVNLALTAIVMVIAILAYVKVPEIMENADYQTEISQIVNDEGLRLTAYKDTLGNGTIGFGHLIVKGEKFGTITPHDAIALLRVDYAAARSNVEKNYPWATGDVKLVLVNMSYQLGPSRLAKFKKATDALESGDYDTAAAELLDSTWARQTPNRASRLAGRILKLNEDWW